MGAATLGVIVGNRDFFPDQLVAEARTDILKLFSQLEIVPVIVGEADTRMGGIETLKDARICAELFRRRRDAFCGKISVCNNLYQCGMPYSLTKKHTVHPTDSRFVQDLQKFVAVCRVVKGLRKVRIGAVGARPGAFNTVRYSEKILARNGISVTTVDLSEILGAAENLDGDDQRVREKLEETRRYANAAGVPEVRLVKIAALGDFMAANALDATAIQCWTSIQQHYGVNVCTSMSMMSEQMMPSACEVDVTGALTMYAMQLASQTPSALVDWNNNYGEDEDRCVLFHCGNWARTYLPGMEIGTAPILGTVVGEENTFGALSGRSSAGPLTFGRVTTDSRGSARLLSFAGRFPKQLVEVGVAEQNLVGIAAGLASTGKKVFAVSPACFLTARALEQIKNDVCYSDNPVKLIGISAGVSYGSLGSTHHALHDLAALRAIHNVEVVVPADNLETREAIRAAAAMDHPVYIRLGKRAMRHLHGPGASFEIGQAMTVRDGSDGAFVATGETVEWALMAATDLADEGIDCRVVSVHTVKPLDVDTVLEAAETCRRVVIVEEHSVCGGLGEACAAAILQAGLQPAFSIVAIPDGYTVTGSQLEIYRHYGISAEGLAAVMRGLVGEGSG